MKSAPDICYHPFLRLESALKQFSLSILTTANIPMHFLLQVTQFNLVNVLRDLKTVVGYPDMAGAILGLVEI